jgi:hypothetical protein
MTKGISGGDLATSEVVGVASGFAQSIGNSDRIAISIIGRASNLIEGIPRVDND